MLTRYLKNIFATPRAGVYLIQQADYSHARNIDRQIATLLHQHQGAYYWLEYRKIWDPAQYKGWLSQDYATLRRELQQQKELTAQLPLIIISDVQRPLRTSHVAGQQCLTRVAELANDGLACVIIIGEDVDRITRPHVDRRGEVLDCFTNILTCHQP